jgi:hypothetical protein
MSGWILEEVMHYVLGLLRSCSWHFVLYQASFSLLEEEEEFSKEFFTSEVGAGYITW